MSNMSSTSSDSLKYISELLFIDYGLFVLTTGVVGNTLNIIIFLSLKTFRDTSCAFYLTVASLTNIIHLIASLLSRILITGYNIDLTRTAPFTCKLRQYVVVIAPLMTVSCMCFATLDQFASVTMRWRHLSQRPIAHRLVIATLLFWCLVNIPVILFHDIAFFSAMVTWTCSITNRDFSVYFSRVHISFLLGFVQLTIRIVFGLMAFINVRSLRNRQMPIIRLERDKQITTMVLAEIVVDVVLSIPFFVYYTYKPVTSITNAADLSLYMLIISITSMLYYNTFAAGFYIYCCSSSRFRKQLTYVLIGIHLRYCCKVNWHERPNQVAP